MQIELSFLDFLQTIHMPVLDGIMIFITHLGDMGLLWIGFTLFLLIHPKFRKLGVCVAISLVLEALICNAALKPLIARTRPYDINTAVTLLIAKPKDYSFPSGHTGISFAVVGALFFRKSRLWIPGFILAILIAFSRMYHYVHFPTDILAGAVIGIITGFIASIIYLKIWPDEAKKQNVVNEV